MKDYLGWQRRQQAPRAISSEIFALCRLPSLPEQAFADSLHGKNLALLDWVNEPAAKGLEAGGKPAFDVGSAIVKQKLLDTQPGAKVVALGIMIKHAAGFDPARRDWEFGYWEEALGLSSGAEAASSCGGCHAGSATDFVFVDQSWRKAH